MGDVLEHVEPGNALGREELRRVRAVLLQSRGNDVSGMDLLTARALDVEHGGLENTAERQRLFRLLLLAARKLFD